ncbi:MAG TPA: DUF86 domain-containing protein [Propionibacteriaceae bacterium]|nr:DUF86 domain-containing protein [Propionibacteriaceae bacterium]
MVDETRVLRLLRGVTDDLAVLQEAETGGPEQRSEPLWLRGVKYTFITAIEACIDVAQHICAAEGWGPPHDNGDALALLGEHKVIDMELASRMRRAVGFRNVLVHEYVDVDDGIVLTRLKDHSDLDQFTRQVAIWLGAN